MKTILMENVERHEIMDVIKIMGVARDSSASSAISTVDID